MCLQNDANDTLSICLLTAKIPQIVGEGGNHRSRGEIEDADDANLGMWVGGGGVLLLKANIFGKRLIHLILMVVCDS